MLDFAITHPNTSTLSGISSMAAIAVTKREYYAEVSVAPSMGYVDEAFGVAVDIMDELNEEVVDDLPEKVYTTYHKHKRGGG